MKELPKPIPIPRWYQDLSIPQMQKVFQLGDIMRADYVERVTGRTQRALGDIGVTSTFVKITSEQIRELRRLAELDPVKFLSEIYRIITGRYFIDEEYKKIYDCNERIILSAIAFLTLPETVIELHGRIPMGETPKFPPKPVLQKIPPRRGANSPYLEPLFTRPDQLAYKRELHLWKQQCQAISIPRAILPPWINHPRNVELPTIVESERVEKEGKERLEAYHEERTDKKKDYTAGVTSHETKSPDRHEDRTVEKPQEKGPKKDHVTITGHETKPREIIEKEATDRRFVYSKSRSNKPSSLAEKDTHSIAAELHENKAPNSRHDYSKRPHLDKPSSIASEETHLMAAGMSEEKIPHSRQDYSRQVRSDEIPQLAKKETRLTVVSAPENEIPNNHLDYSKRLHSDKKSWLGEKDMQLVITGVCENADYPLSQEISGLAYVTPNNSNESFFAELNITDARKKKYPRGRENLSRNWQEWLQTADEDFMKVEKDANKIIKSIQDTLRLMGPEISCDDCCSCRQTRKTNINYYKTKTPHIVIDSVAMDGKQNKYIVGSLSMNSPAPSPSESTADLPEVIASHDKIIKNKIISGVTNEKGETKYDISGVSKEIERVPRKVINNSKLPKPIKNAPPCGCAIEKMINEGLTTVTSDDDIPWTKNDALCIGQKYRPKAIGAGQQHPSDKFCRRNPFKKKVDEKIKATLRAKNNVEEDDYPSEKKNMYSLAAFQPCGDEDGMAICGGPWGAVNVPDAEELARRDAEAKLILESRPCGDKPGRAICGAPFGSRHPIPKKPKKDDDEDDEEEEEELDEEELKEKKKREREARKMARVQVNVEKLLNRDERCSTVAGKIQESDKNKESTLAHRTVKMKKDRSTKIGRSDKKRKSSRGSESEYDSKANSRDKRKSSESNDSTKSRNRMRGRSREEKKQDDADQEKITRRAQTKQVKNQWNRMKRLANKFVVTPIVLPEEQPRMCKREDRRVCCEESEEDRRLLDEESTREGPFGWRTKSEEELPSQKTLVYLVNAEEPVEKVPVRPGGKPCECRDNRNKKKTLLYNVTAMVPEGKGKRDSKNSRVIDGLIYITPTPSVRISEEYVPEYELYDSPYEMCARERKNDDFKYLEKYLGPESLMMKKSRASGPCNCSSTKQNIVNDLPSQALKQNENELIVKEAATSVEKKWENTFKDEGLVNFYARCRDNVPCWLRCMEFSKDGCCVVPRTLRVKRPVCECKYERKILKREEEKTNWLRRQEKLKAMKKQPCSQVVGLSRPMRTETNVMISNVTRIHREDADIDDIEYCVNGIAQDRVMGPAECILSGVGMHTPLVTPEISKAEIPISKPHRHWSPMNIQDRTADLPIGTGQRNLSPINMQTRPAAFANAEKVPRRDTNETDWKNKLRDKADRRVDVLYQSGRANIETDQLERKKPDYIVEPDKKMAKDRTKGKVNKLPSILPAIEQPLRSQTARSINEQDKKTKKDRTYGKASKAEKLPSKPPSIEEPRRSQTARSNNAESKQKSSAPPAIQQSQKFQTVGSVHVESKKKSSAKELGKMDKSNIHIRKSTGNISSKETKMNLPDKRKKASSKIDLTKLLQIELEKMAGEGFLFAKLPDCHRMPQLRYWIMYRKGVAFAADEKKKLMDQSIKIWNAMEKSKPKKIEAPAIEMSKKALENLTFDKAEGIRRDVASKKAKFYSKVRKLRVLQARAMWNLMEFGKFPGVSFKKAYFTYQAGKEAEGFVFKPWEKE